MFSHLPRNPIRRGFTLVEMMISVALTLMVVFALVRVFEALGENVTDSRATIEMSGNLRSAAQLLRRDLEGLTVTVLPPRSPDQGEGYFEIVDGPSTDSQHVVQSQENGVLGIPQMVSLSNRTPGFVDLNSDGLVEMDVDGLGFVATEFYDTSVGDVDDVLAFTTRRMDQPFSGKVTNPLIRRRLPDNTRQPLGITTVAPTRTVEANEAEVVWWLQVERNVATPESMEDFVAYEQLPLENQLAIATSAPGEITGFDASTRVLTAQRYPNFTSTTLGTPVRSLHRRVLLIRPDLDLSAVVLRGQDQLAAFLNNNDISVRITRTSSNPPVYSVAANSLKDLTHRQNRAYRLGPSSALFSAASVIKKPALTRIHDFRSGPNGEPYAELMNHDSYLLLHGAMKDMVLDFDGDYGTTNDKVIMLRKGNDVVLSDVLAFDLQVWDPQAVVRVAADGTAMSPSDPGYQLPDAVSASRGTYVDLGFAVSPKSGEQALGEAFHGYFGGLPHLKSQLPINQNSSFRATYCTWNSHYERDGYDQDDAVDDDAGADQATNGADDDGVFGVDDPGEAETFPPYPHPIRGLEVTMRIMDFTTRQVRQTSIATDFLPE